WVCLLRRRAGARTGSKTPCVHARTRDKSVSMDGQPINKSAEIPWRAIGTEPWKGIELFYLFDTPLGISRFRRADLSSVTVLGELDANTDRWRGMFPGQNRRGIDTVAAASWLIAQCRIAQAKRDAEKNKVNE